LTELGCSDIDECLTAPCHQSAKCYNNPGSFKCTCEVGRVGNPYGDPGCLLPDQCLSDEDCAENLGCISGKCADPCRLTGSCGPMALCQVNTHQLTCSCPPGHLGDPNDQNVGCFRVECVTDNDCYSDKNCDNQAHKCISEFKMLIL
jgi:hypothetical protein